MTTVRELLSRPTPTRWGRWRLTDDRAALVIVDGHMARYVDLDRCTTDADRWFWTRHYAGKGWTTIDDVTNLVAALHQLTKETSA